MSFVNSLGSDPMALIEVFRYFMLERPLFEDD